jgi:hypothetical protein
MCVCLCTCVCSRIGTRLISISTHRSLLVRWLDLEFQKVLLRLLTEVIVHHAGRHHPRKKSTTHILSCALAFTSLMQYIVTSEENIDMCNKHVLSGQLTDTHTHTHTHPAANRYQNRCVVRYKTFQLSNMQRVSASASVTATVARTVPTTGNGNKAKQRKQPDDTNTRRTSNKARSSLFYFYN